MSHGPDSTLCYNCGAALQGHFCAYCGQKAQPLNPSFHDLVHDFTHEMLHVDGRIFQSMRRLLLSPGFLTREYFEGRRARWISPLRLYLIFSLVYFALASFDARIVVTGDTDEETLSGLQQLGFQSEEEIQAAVRAAQSKWIPRVMFLLVPLFAWLVHLVCRRSGRRYPQHLYCALHMHAAWFAALAIAAAAQRFSSGAVASAVNVLAVLYGLVYLVLALRTAYGGSTRRVLGRAAILAAVYYVVVLLTILAVVLPVIFWRVEPH